MSEADKIKAYADRFANLLNSHKEDVAALIEEVKGDEIDAPTLRRLVSFMRQDAAKRDERQALDDQYRFLAGLAPTPADLPPESEIAKARALFADGLTIRAVAEQLKISVGKAHALKAKAAAFDVHVQMNMNTPALTDEQIASMRALAAAGDRARAIRAVQSTIPAPAVWQEIAAAREEHEARVAAEREAARERRRAAERRLAEFNARVDADTLEIPPFLRREKVRA